VQQACARVARTGSSEGPPLSAPESFTTPGAGGTPIQYWVFKPPNFTASRKYPVVVIIHGGPQSASQDAWSYRWNPALWAAQGWVVAVPNPRGSTGFGQKFVDEISQDWCGKVMTHLNSVFDTVAKLPHVDGSRMGIAGASYGGYAVNWVIGQTGRFKGGRVARWRVQPRIDGARDRRAVVRRVARTAAPRGALKRGTISPAPRRTSTRTKSGRRRSSSRTSSTSACRSIRGLQLFTALRRNGVPAKTLVFPLSRRPVSTLPHQAGGSEGDHGDGAQTRRVGVSHAEIRQEYVDKGMQYCEDKHRQQQIRLLTKKAARLGLQIVQPDDA
jgi:acetyl esterase/lipase